MWTASLSAVLLAMILASTWDDSHEKKFYGKLYEIIFRLCDVTETTASFIRDRGRSDNGAIRSVRGRNLTLAMIYSLNILLFL